MRNVSNSNNNNRTKREATACTHNQTAAKRRLLTQQHVQRTDRCHGRSIEWNYKKKNRCATQNETRRMAVESMRADASWGGRWASEN